MKSAYTQFYQIEHDQQAVNDALYNQLQQKLFVQKTTRSKFFSVRMFSLSLVGLVVVILGIASFGLITKSHNSQVAIKNAAKTLLDPKVALADSLNNTFGKDSLTQSFGLGDPNIFRYRKIEVTMPNNKRMPEIPKNGIGSNDPNYQAFLDDWKKQPNYSLTDTIDLWGYKGNGRLDAIFRASDKALPEQVATSALISQYDQMNCEPELGADPTRKERCLDLFESAEQKAQQELMMSDITFTAKNVDPSFITAIKATRGTRTVQASDKTLNYPEIFIDFATKNALATIPKIAYYSHSGSGGFDALLNDSTNLHHYRNHKIDDLYWHGTEEDQELTDNGIFYIQFITGNRSSSIYEYHSSDQSMIAVDYQTMVNNIQDDILQESFMENLYRGYLNPILFVITHPDQFTQPIEQANEIKANHNTTRLRYKLTDDYAAEVRIGFGGAMFDHQDPAYMDIWFDPQTNQVISYNLLDQDHQAQIEVVITEDKVIDTIQPQQFFSYAYWKQAVELKDEDIITEPFAFVRPNYANMKG